MKASYIFYLYVTDSYLQIIEAENETEARRKLIAGEQPHWTMHRNRELRFEMVRVATPEPEQHVHRHFSGDDLAPAPGIREICETGQCPNPVRLAGEP